MVSSKKQNKTIGNAASGSAASENVTDVVSAITALMSKLNPDQLKTIKQSLKATVTVPSIKTLQSDESLAALPIPVFENLNPISVDAAEGNTFKIDKVYYSSQFSRRTGKPYTSIQLYGTVLDGKLKKGQRFRILTFLSSYNGESPLKNAKPIGKTIKGYGFMYSTQSMVTVKNGKVTVLESGQ